MVTKLILTSKLNNEKRKKIILENKVRSLEEQIIIYKKFIKRVRNLESPNGHFGRLRSPIILSRLMLEAKKIERRIEDVRLKEKARQL